MNFVKSLDQFLNKAEKAGIVLLLSVMVTLSFLQVVLRLTFSTSLLWADTLLRHLVLWVGLLGAAVATSEGSHFAIDFLKKHLPENWSRPVSILTNVLAVIILALLVHPAWKYFVDDLENGSILFSIANLHVPSAWITIIIPIGFFLLAFHFLLKVFSKDS